MEDDGITKLIDGDIYYHYYYADYLYQELNKKDKEIQRLNNIIDETTKLLDSIYMLDNVTITNNATEKIDEAIDLLKGALNENKM